MSLEVNKNDFSIDMTNLSTGKVNYQRVIAGVLVTITLYSGSLLGTTKVNAAETTTSSYSQSIDSIAPTTIVEIPEPYQYEVYECCGKKQGEKLTINDLNNINSQFMTLSIKDDSSLEWLNYLGKIEFLNLIIHTSDVSTLQKVKTLSQVKNLSIISMESLEIDSDTFKFLRNSTNIEKVTFNGAITIEPGFVESLQHLNTLSFNLKDGNYNYDCSKLHFLRKLIFYDPYTVAINITTKDYERLIQDGVKVSFSTPEELETFKDINRRLDNIVEGLGVDENSSDQEKLDAILCYVLDNLTYDPEISEAIRNNQPHEQLSKKFYYGGLLYGALEKGTAICGNYTALTNALAKRLNLNTFYLTSNNHAWSLVEVEGIQYYVDATWMDGNRIYKKETITEYDDFGRVTSQMTSFMPLEASEAIKEGNTDQLKWYMEDPTSYPKSEKQSESHIVVNLPSYFGIVPQEEMDDTSIEETPSEPSESIRLDEEIVEVRSDAKSWFISGAAAIGTLCALGGAVAVKKTKEKNRRKRNHNYTSSDPFDDMFTSSSTNNSSNGRRR